MNLRKWGKEWVSNLESVVFGAFDIEHFGVQVLIQWIISRDLAVAQSYFSVIDRFLKS